MEQKRKVKNLLLKGDGAGVAFFTILLLILSVILCIGAASLVTFALADETVPFTYTGLDDNKEVIYRMRFFDPSDFTEVQGDVYIEDENLYMTSRSIVVNPATLDELDIDRLVNILTGVYGHILGGSGNKLYSNNVTMIAGNDNILTGGNDNATVLGGEGNRFVGRSSGIPMVSIGGQNNKSVMPHDGIAFIGGSNNEITGYDGNDVENVFMLGGDKNTIELSSNVKNVVVGGRNVKVTSGNVFVFSNSNDEFQVNTGDAFVLNLTGGVGINSDLVEGSLSIENAVSIGDVNIETQTCGYNPIYGDEIYTGTVGTYSGCLVGCTRVSKPDSKWEMLDGGERCADLCSFMSGSCVLKGNLESDVEYTGSYDAHCTVDTVEHATLCPNSRLGLYKNVIFETSLVDSDAPCPIGYENQCVFQCDYGYHLTGDVSGGDIKCYKDCDLPWGGKLKHNGTVIGYNTGNVSCSNHIYLFPFDTELINRGVPGLSPSVSIGKKFGYDNKATNGYSPETCGNYEHKKTLICNNGVLELMDPNGKPIEGSSGHAQKYKYETCSLYNYSCVTGYNLTEEQISGDKKDGPANGGTWYINDRTILTGVRGIYSGCIDYNASGLESCSTGQYHYAFIGCNSGFHLSGDVCMQDCVFSGVSYKHNTSGITGYANETVTCTGTCEFQLLHCDDGKWRNDDEVEVTGFSTNCTLKNYECEGYDVFGVTYNQYSGTSIYESCDPYSASGQFLCVKQDTKYKLVGCKEGYHAEYDTGKYCTNNWGIASCPSIPSHSHWVWSGGIVKDYPRKSIFSEIKLGEYVIHNYGSYTGGYYVKAWTGGWKPLSGGYWDTGHMYPSNACEWKCDTNYHRIGNVCEPDTRESSCDEAPAHSSGWVNGKYKQRWNETEWTPPKPDNTCVTTGANAPQCSFMCNAEYTCNESLTGCRKIENGECRNTELWGCKNEHDTAVNTGVTLTGATWYCESRDGIRSIKCRYECGENEIFSDNECVSLECHHCAKNGFPYCFPIDFSVSCQEYLLYD